jgi:hypothetical protein
MLWSGRHGCARGWRARAQLPARDGSRARAQGLARGRGFVSPLPVGNVPIAIYKSGGRGGGEYKAPAASIFWRGGQTRPYECTMPSYTPAGELTMKTFHLQMRC